ncbi:CDP-alcohol phosphatidyltransferase family protein [Microlunatus capsulatus]|uniref:Phosphatidylglycerophosphate synthase n=1 Tax=Microlunatus capsulatus TaxID=99117 RepID=A0ABS4ZAA3_9ACTN|nr:CDP-alcohol phosphatidyltransferase family protein [Microlunatus capsulatus]MBP2417705.1 phosphatidylglycerophosphate synthase [Microlunatus capsulatus]
MAAGTQVQARGFGAAHAQLRNAQKTSKGAPAYSLYVNRPLGRVFAAAAFQVGMTPNQVTCVSALATFSGIVWLAAGAPTWLTGIGVCLLLVLGYALDSADGQLARLRGGGSPAGEWLDHMFDAAKNSMLHLAVLIIAFRHFDLALGWLLVPIAFTVVTAVMFFGMLLNDFLARVDRAQHGRPAPSTEGSTPLRTLMKIPADYGVLCLVFLVLGAPLVFFTLYGLLGLGTLGYLALALRKWYRDVSALGAPERVAA